MVNLEGGESHLHRQPGLADTAGSHERDETGAVKQLATAASSCCRPTKLLRAAGRV